MVLLQFCRWNFVAEFIRFLYTKMTNLLFYPPFGGCRGDIRISSIARWIARGRPSIRDN